MGWATKAAKLGIRAIRNAPNKRKLADEIIAAKSMLGKIGKGVDRETYREMLGRTSNINGIGYYIKDSGEAVKRALNQARRMKAEEPAIYAKAKRAVQMRVESIGKSDKRREMASKASEFARSAIEKPELAYYKKMGGQHPGTYSQSHAQPYSAKVMTQLKRLAARNLLPAAAAVAGLTAASKRNQKPQGYAMGGVVPSQTGASAGSGKGAISLARKAKNAVGRAYDTANDYITNARLTRFIASHAPEALRVGKYSLRTSARNLAKWGPWAKTIAKLDSGPAIALTEGLPLMHQGLKRQQRRQIASMEAAKGDKNAVWTGAPDFPGDLSIPYQISKNFSGKGYAYGGMVSKKLSRKKKGK